VSNSNVRLPSFGVEVKEDEREGERRKEDSIT